MPQWLENIADFLEFSWSGVVLGLAVFIVTSVGGILLVRILLVRLPATYFCDSHPRDFWRDKHPVQRWLGKIGKNVLGLIIVALGIVMSVPGVPGPGILAILIGITLVDFPGKRRFERWMIGRPKILHWVNGFRQRHHRLPLEL